jgi:hypothetical protein
VASHLVGELLRKALKSLSSVLVEVLRADVIGDRRAIVDLLSSRPVALLLSAVATRFVGSAVTPRRRRLAVTASGRRFAISSFGGLPVTTSRSPTSPLTCRFAPP